METHNEKEFALEKLRSKNADMIVLNSLNDACLNSFPGTDIAVMSAAVADYTITDPSNEKIKKSGDNLTIGVKKTTDILIFSFEGSVIV